MLLPVRVVAFTLLLALTAAGCVKDYGEAPFACASNVCPEGYLCVAKVCRREQSAPRDARVEPPRKDSWPRTDGFQPRDGRGDTWRSDLLAPRDIDRFPDLGGKSCAQTLLCYGQCGNETCGNACYAALSPVARALMDALESCWQSAANGGCYMQCHPDGPSCDLCLDGVCAKQLAACKAN